MAKYSKRQLKKMLRTRCAPVDAPAYIFQELEKMRRKMNREIPNMKDEMDNFMHEMRARTQPWIPAKSLRGRLIVGIIGIKNRLNRTPGWMVKFREFMLDTFWDY